MNTPKNIILNKLSPLSLLKDGWLDGHGSAFSSKEIEEAVNILQAFSVEGVQLPEVIPMECGILFEWVHINGTPTVEINFGKELLYFHVSREDGSNVEAEVPLLEMKNLKWMNIVKAFIPKQ